MTKGGKRWKMTKEEFNRERLEQEILLNAGKDIVSDYEMLKCEDFLRIWGEPDY